MRHHLLFSANIMPPAAARKPTAAAATKPLSPQASNSPNCPSLCRHSPSATLDLLIFVVVLFSGAFLITSYFSYIFQSLSLLPPRPALPPPRLRPPIAVHLLRPIHRLLPRLHQPLRDLLRPPLAAVRPRRLQGAGAEEGGGVRFAAARGEPAATRRWNTAVRDVNSLPWKGGGDDNPDYECLRAELRKMAPPNGRAVLLFCLRCGCPMSKLEGWGPKRGRRHKKGAALPTKVDQR